MVVGSAVACRYAIELSLGRSFGGEVEGREVSERGVGDKASRRFHAALWAAPREWGPWNGGLRRC